MPICLYTVYHRRLLDLTVTSLGRMGRIFSSYSRGELSVRSPSLMRSHECTVQRPLSIVSESNDEAGLLVCSN